MQVSGDAVFQAAALEGMVHARVLEALTTSKLFKSHGSNTRGNSPTPGTEPEQEGPAEGELCWLRALVCYC